MSKPAYLVDSDWVVSALKGRPEAHALLTTLAPQGLAISLITYAEIYQGIYYGRDPQRHERGFLDFIRDVAVIPLNKRIMKQFARTRGDLQAKGAIVADFDILIAVTALHYDLILATRNIRHYQRISGLRLYSQ